jgi:hypothetical protein
MMPLNRVHPNGHYVSRLCRLSRRFLFVIDGRCCLFEPGTRNFEMRDEGRKAPGRARHWRSQQDSNLAPSWRPFSFVAFQLPLPRRGPTQGYCSCPLNEARFPEVNARMRTPSDRTIKAIGVGSTLWNTASFFT